MIRKAPDLDITIASETDIGVLSTLEAKSSCFPWSKENLFNSLSANHHCYKFLLDNVVCGFAVLRQIPPELELLNFVIAKTMQNRGLGARFLELTLNLDIFNLCNNIWLEVRASNQAAIRMYKNQGFIEAGVRKDYYAAGKFREDGILMNRSRLKSG